MKEENRFMFYFFFYFNKVNPHQNPAVSDCQLPVAAGALVKHCLN